MKAIFILAFTALMVAVVHATSHTFGINIDFLYSATTCVLLYLIVGIVVGLQAEVDTDPSLSGMGLVLVALVWPLLILLSVIVVARAWVRR